MLKGGVGLTLRAKVMGVDENCLEEQEEMKEKGKAEVNICA